MLKGLSLSMCVADVLAGRVAEEDIHSIEAGTAARTEDDWARVVSDYQTYYWSRDPKEGAAVVARLREAGKIVQPRLSNPDLTVPSIAGGWWQDLALP